MNRPVSGFQLAPQVKSFEKDRQSEKRILESELVDHIIQKCRTKLSEERNRYSVCVCASACVCVFAWLPECVCVCVCFCVCVCVGVCAHACLCVCVCVSLCPCGFGRPP